MVTDPSVFPAFIKPRGPSRTLTQYRQSPSFTRFAYALALKTIAKDWGKRMGRLFLIGTTSAALFRQIFTDNAELTA